MAFTGSTETALAIRARWPITSAPSRRSIAETGGLNAMIVDSTALPEQVVRDIMRLDLPVGGPALFGARLLFVQEDVAQTVIEMLVGAMEELDSAIRSTSPPTSAR